MSDYIDMGDRVVVKPDIAESAHARMPRPGAIGKHGVVLENDGYGMCTVRLDDDGVIHAWNAKDLEREAT